MSKWTWLFPIVTLVASCADPSNPSSYIATTASGLNRAGGAHIMLVHRGPKAQSKRNAAGGATLTYYGGPILQKVHVIPVYWGSGVQFTSQLDSFYAAVPNSPYYDW